MKAFKLALLFVLLNGVFLLAQRADRGSWEAAFEWHFRSIGIITIIAAVGGIVIWCAKDFIEGDPKGNIKD